MDIKYMAYLQNEELEGLLRQAKTFVQSPAQHKEQIISFAYGNAAASNPAITRDMVEQAYEELYGTD